MNKTGWQASAILLASVAMVFAAAAWNSGRAVDVLNAELSKRGNTNCETAPEADTVLHKYYELREAAPAFGTRQYL